MPSERETKKNGRTMGRKCNRIILEKGGCGSDANALHSSHFLFIEQFFCLFFLALDLRKIKAEHFRYSLSLSRATAEQKIEKKSEQPIKMFGFVALQQNKTQKLSTEKNKMEFTCQSMVKYESIIEN